MKSVGGRLDFMIDGAVHGVEFAQSIRSRREAVLLGGALTAFIGLTLAELDEIGVIDDAAAIGVFEIHANG